MRADLKHQDLRTDAYLLGKRLKKLPCHTENYLPVETHVGTYFPRGILNQPPVYSPLILRWLCLPRDAWKCLQTRDVGEVSNCHQAGRERPGMLLNILTMHRVTPDIKEPSDAKCKELRKPALSHEGLERGVWSKHQVPKWTSSFSKQKHRAPNNLWANVTLRSSASLGSYSVPF